MNTEIVERSFTAEQRKKLAKSGAALPDGSFPIENKSDLENAIQAVGRASNSAAAKAHIKKRAKALGCTDCIPDTWESWQAVTGGELIVEASFKDGDSHSGLEKKLSSAIDGKVQAGEDMDGDGDNDAPDRATQSWPLHYVRAVHDNHVIYSMGGKTFAHKYEKDEDGDPHLKGSPIEVEPSYETVKTKESFGESAAFDATSTFQESNGYDAAKGEITMTVIKPGWSLNNRYYSPEMLKRDYKVFENAKMFMNHQTDKEANQRPEGDLRDWVAQVTKVWPESDGTIRAKAVVIDPTLKAKMSSLAENKLLPQMGVSIRAAGEAHDGEAEGKSGKIIEAITAARSVDFVTFPGAGGAVETLQ